MEISVIAPVIIFFASLIQSVFGFGSALFAMPLLVMFISPSIATPMVALISATIGVAMLAKDWRHINVQPVIHLIVSSAVGVPVGLLFLVHADIRLVKLILGLVIFFNSVFTLLASKKIKMQGKFWLYASGFFSGVLGGAYNISGPPVVVYAINQKWSATTLVVSLQAYFLATGFIIIAGHWFSGFWTEKMFSLFSLCLPCSLLGVWAGKKIRNSFAPSMYERMVHILLALVGLLLFVQGFYTINL